MLNKCQKSVNIFFLNVVRGTPRTILDPPRHFLDKNKYRKYFRQKLLLTTSNDPLDASQMLPNNSNICQTNVKISVKNLGWSRVLDHQATEGDWIAPTPFARPAGARRGFFPSKKQGPQNNNACLLRKLCFVVEILLLLWPILTQICNNNN